jgi:hypothetical protein
MRVGIQAALQIAVVAASTSLGAAELSPRAADRPTGDVWISASGSQRAFQANDRPEAATALRTPHAETPNRVAAPAQEFKFNITLTIRGIGHGNRTLRPPRAADFARRTNCLHHRLRSTHCVG